MKTWMCILPMLLLCVTLRADGNLEAFTARHEADIAARVSGEKNPRRKLQLEYLLRQRYDEAMQRRIEQLVKGPTLESPELTELRARRDALMKDVRAVEEAIVKVGYDTEPVKAQQEVRKANADRIAALYGELWPAEDGADDESQDDKPEAAAAVPPDDFRKE